MIKKTLTASIAAFALVLSGGYAVAHADTAPQPAAPQAAAHARGTWGASNGMGQGSDMHMGSTTGMRPGMGGPGHASSTDGMMFRGIPGIVTGIDTSSFSLATRGKDQATTTLTVNVTDATKFNEGSTTASFSSVTVGAHVAVVGTLSTSTKTVAATRVMIGGPDMNGMGDKGEAAHKPPAGGFIQKLKNFFTDKHASSTDAQGTSSISATADSPTFLGKIAHSLFGWL